GETTVVAVPGSTRWGGWAHAHFVTHCEIGHAFAQLNNLASVFMTDRDRGFREHAEPPLVGEESNVGVAQPRRPHTDLDLPGCGCGLRNLSEIERFIGLGELPCFHDQLISVDEPRVWPEVCGNHR